MSNIWRLNHNYYFTDFVSDAYLSDHLSDSVMMAAMTSDKSTREKKIDFLSGVRYEHLVAGVGGGVISTCLLHPLDLLKIRWL